MAIPFLLRKVHPMHLHVGIVSEGEAYEAVEELFPDPQQPGTAQEYFEDPNQSSEEPKATEEGKHRSMNPFDKSNLLLVDCCLQPTCFCI